MPILQRLPPSHRTLPALLELQAQRFGARPLVRDASASLTYAEALERAAVVAGTLAAGGVRPGDRVAVLSENRLEVIELWLGCAWLGAILVPLNTALRGGQLGHALADSGSRLLVIEAGLAPMLDFIDTELPALQRLWALGEPAGNWRGIPVEAFTATAAPLPPYPARPGDACMILYTSGTTGRSKGVLCPHAQWYWWALATGGALDVTEEDVLYTCLPLFHTNALNAFVQALVAGTTLVLGPRFSASAFWRRLAESEATVTYLLGAMVHILSKPDPDPDERRHRTRIALAPGTPEALYAPFEERFGIGIVDAWGSTETNIVLSTAHTEAPRGSMGSITPGFQARVVDGDDEEVPHGTPGELVVRSEEPYAFALGYHGLPEATAESRRNLWFHSGDCVMRDEAGYFWFLDRLKDSIRRRGENISSYEVELVLTAHPDILAAAVVPVPSELGEDEVLACVVVRDGSAPSAEDLIGFCEPRLAYFAIPRYVDFASELPLTASGKVEKYKLRERGVTPSTWDREQACYVLRR